MRKWVPIIALVVALAGPGLARADLASGFAAYDRGDYATALVQFRLLANEGDAAAQFVLGRMHENGQGVRPDRQSAIEWYRRAAEQGYGPAETQLSRLVPGLAPGASPLDPVPLPDVNDQASAPATGEAPYATQPDAADQPVTTGQPQIGSARQDALFRQRAARQAGAVQDDVPHSPTGPAASGSDEIEVARIPEATEPVVPDEAAAQPDFVAPAVVDQNSLEQLYFHYKSMALCDENGVVDYDTGKIAETVTKTEKSNRVSPALARKLRDQADARASRFQQTLAGKTPDDKEFECKSQSRLFALYHNKLNPVQ